MVPYYRKGTVLFSQKKIHKIADYVQTQVHEMHKPFRN